MAEEIITQETQEQETQVQAEQKEQELSVEEQLQQLRLENARLKRATDRATSEAANFKKQLREKQTTDEIAAQEKADREAEREEQFNALLRENKITKLEKQFLALGYNAENATKAATAQYDGDMDTLFKIQSEVQASMIRAKEAEWIKNRPEVNAGAGGEKTSVTKEQFDKMGYKEIVEFKNKYPETYKKYMS